MNKTLILFASVMVGFLVNAGAQSGTASRAYRARLSPVPMDLAMAVNISGLGTATATLNGSKLTITGTFDGLKSPATTVNLHRGIRGVRGPVVLALETTKGTSGTISGTVDLTPMLAQDLQNSRLYIQLQSEKAPDGNLWGWLMPQETKK
ncbi:MAG: CHRD domain-containing protein [Acidobacteriaceae bacterium]|jgi:hypothetical protein|nr:CHRD domain-containing protein [Acidobacteriaceae bacterium]